jgi:dCMP deaminase
MDMEKELIWHERWFNLVDLVSSWSKDSTKVGAVIIPKNSDIPIIGWNGFPRKFKDLPERYNFRETKYKYVVHAEMNAIYNSARNSINILDSTLYTTCFPCNECAKAIAQSGISKVYYKNQNKDFWERWKVSIETSMLIFDEIGIQYIEYKENA